MLTNSITQTVASCQNMVACNNNDNFEDAKEFKPERWLKESGEFDTQNCIGSSIVVPFGFGKKSCPGRKYTEMELMIMVIKLVKSFRIKYCSSFDKKLEFILAPESPVNIQFEDRLTN